MLSVEIHNETEVHNLKIIDFGSAVKFDPEENTKMGKVLGTAFYIAP
jgi:hypothetical protein